MKRAIVVGTLFVVVFVLTLLTQHFYVNYRTEHQFHKATWWSVTTQYDVLGLDATDLYCTHAAAQARANREIQIDMIEKPWLKDLTERYPKFFPIDKVDSWVRVLAVKTKVNHSGKAWVWYWQDKPIGCQRR